MVILGKRKESSGEDLMEIPKERSNPMHNFQMPFLKWGSRKVMRCMKVNSNGEVPNFDHRRSSETRLIGRINHSKLGSTDRNKEVFKFSPSPAEEDGRSGKPEKETEEGIELVREKLMFDLQTEADKMKDAILREGLIVGPPPRPPPPPTLPPLSCPATNDAARPWNLRTRRAACKEPTNGSNCVGGGRSSLTDSVFKSSLSPLRTETKLPRSSRGSPAAGAPSSPRERLKFSLSLSRQEIADDYLAMTGHRLPRRPKRRTRTVQKQLDMLFPGLWLTEVNVDLYKVPDAPETGKR